MIRFLVTRKAARFHVGSICRQSLAKDFGNVSIGSYKLWLGRKTQSSQVVEYQHLTIAVGAGADPDRGDS